MSYYVTFKYCFFHGGDPWHIVHHRMYKLGLSIFMPCSSYIYNGISMAYLFPVEAPLLVQLILEVSTIFMILHQTISRRIMLITHSLSLALMIQLLSLDIH